MQESLDFQRSLGEKQSSKLELIDLDLDITVHHERKKEKPKSRNQIAKTK